MNVQLIQTLPSVRATLNYVLPTAEKPFSYTYTPPPGVPERSRKVDVEEVTIRDARPLIGQLSLEDQGFELMRHPTAVTDFYDEAQLKNVYYPEVERLVQRATGAENVVIFDHTIRSVPKFQAGVEGYRDPVRIIHNDYTVNSGPRRVRDHADPAE